NRVLSSSSSSRSSPSSNTSILIPQTPRRRTMEEVWKDITLSTFHQERPITPLDHHIYHHHHHANSSPSFKGMILQDFLTGPSNRPLPVSQTLVEQLPLPPHPSPALPETALSLNSGLEFQYLGPDATNSHSNSSSSGHNASFISSAFSSVAVGPPSPTGLFSLCSKKRLQENPAIGVDRHHKRMIKNRESAARSRARKQAWNLMYPLDETTFWLQAYTNELELEVSNLKEENAKLKKQYEELRLAIGNPLPKRNPLRRSTTAPF
ncbi:unnamed protein product, partial [Musa textilis]